MVTADALHAQREHAKFLVTDKNAHFILVVKNNQPGLYAQLRSLPWRQVPVACDAGDKGHGRAERRTFKLTAVAAGNAFAHAAQAIQGCPSAAAERDEEVVYPDGLRRHQPDPHPGHPAQVAGWIRGHWGIEAFHHIHDVTYAEDASQIRAGNGPQVIAILRNLGIAILKPVTPASPPPAATTPATPPAPWQPLASAHHDQDGTLRHSRPEPRCRPGAGFRHPGMGLLALTNNYAPLKTESRSQSGERAGRWWVS